jgi:hypothetical protein
MLAFHVFLNGEASDLPRLALQETGSPMNVAASKALAAVSITLSLFAAAKAEDKHFSAMGFGTRTCAEFATAYKFDQEWESRFFDWAQGYISGSNGALLDLGKNYFDLASVDLDAQRSYIRDYCDKHPLGTYLQAVLQLVNQLRTMPAPAQLNRKNSK